MIVLGDLHGNLEALEAILTRTSGERRLLSLGDVLGRAGNPETCVRRLSERERTRCVIGNHEQRVLRSGDDASVDGDLAAETRRCLENWARVEKTSRWTACHAAPEDPRVYLFDRAEIAAVMAEVQTPILFSAHTHRPMWYRGSSHDGLTEQAVRPGVRMDFDPGARHFLNPGSASQPLATDLPPTYLEVDWAEKTLRWHALPSVERSRPGFP